MLNSFIGIDGKDHLICNWNDLKIKLQFVVGEILNMFLMAIGFLLGLVAALQVDFVQD